MSGQMEAQRGQRALQEAMKAGGDSVISRHCSYQIKKRPAIAADSDGTGDGDEKWMNDLHWAKHFLVTVTFNMVTNHPSLSRNEGFSWI
jgi:hypothetical protein